MAMPWCRVYRAQSAPLLSFSGSILYAGSICDIVTKQISLVSTAMFNYIGFGFCTTVLLWPRQFSVSTWRHGRHVGAPKQRNSGHVGAPTRSSGKLTSLLWKHFFFFSLKLETWLLTSWVKTNNRLSMLNRYTNSWSLTKDRAPKYATHWSTAQDVTLIIGAGHLWQRVCMATHSYNPVT